MNREEEKKFIEATKIQVYRCAHVFDQTNDRAKQYAALYKGQKEI